MWYQKQRALFKTLLSLAMLELGVAGPGGRPFGGELFADFHQGLHEGRTAGTAREAPRHACCIATEEKCVRTAERGLESRKNSSALLIWSPSGSAQVSVTAVRRSAALK